MPTANPPPNSVHPESRAAWRVWLAEHQDDKQGVWLITYKKAAGKPFIAYNDAVEEALCFGWIDSKPAKLDAERTMLWFAPRKRGSAWSRLNKDRVDRLIANGLMADAGLSKIDAAKRDGSWNALDEVDQLLIPPDMRSAFDAYPGSGEKFEAFPKSTKRGILEWISNAKRPETRAKRLDETARLAAQNIRANQWP